MRAVMGAPLPNHDTCNWRATFRAGFAGALVDAKIILEITAPVDPINTGAVAGDAIAQNGTDARKQPGSLPPGNGIGGGERMQASQVQGFIHIDIPHAGQERLVEQEWFELAMGVLQTIEQLAGSETLIQRLGAKVTQHAGQLIHQPDSAELAGIVEGQLQAAIQLEQQAIMGGGLSASRPHQQVATHAQVEEQPACGELQHQEFAAPGYILDLLARESRLEFSRGGLGQGARPQQIDCKDKPADDGRLGRSPEAQGAGDRFNFWELRHGIDQLNDYT